MDIQSNNNYENPVDMKVSCNKVESESCWQKFLDKELNGWKKE